MFDLGKLSASLMLTLISVAKLLLHLNDTAPSLRWSMLEGAPRSTTCSARLIRSSSIQKRALALTWVGSFCSA
jgi:hypothetical protein